jgi:hypothetical protein
MGGETGKPTRPGFQAGIPLERVPDGGMLSGRVGDEAVLLARRGKGSSPSAQRVRITAHLSPTESSRTEA